MVYLNDFFNDYSVNVFTDASMNSSLTAGCVGVCVVTGPLDKRFPMLRTSTTTDIVKPATNNTAEARAVEYGIDQIIMNPNLFNRPKIRLFSDSQITIFGLRDRIFKWRVKKTKDEFVGTVGSIKNQEIFLAICHLINFYNLKIELYHQSGHVDFSDQKSLDKAARDFAKDNAEYLNGDQDIDPELIRALSYFNNHVDRVSRDHLLSTKNIMDYNTKFPLKFTQCAALDRESLYSLLHNGKSLHNQPNYFNK